LRALRANRVFRADEKRIRAENAVIDKSKNVSDLLSYKIDDCVRMGFSSAHNRRSARTASVRASEALTLASRERNYGCRSAAIARSVRQPRLPRG
jgi:hypothetical protein